MTMMLHKRFHAQSTHEETKTIAVNETSYAKLDLGEVAKMNENYNKVLGLQWKFDSDEFILTFGILVEFSKNSHKEKFVEAHFNSI